MKRTPISTLLVLVSLVILACSTVSLPSLTAAEATPTFPSIPTPPQITQPSFEADTNTPTNSGLENENLLAELPDGFKVAYQAEQGNQTITEMVAESETVDEWTTMVTVQVYLGQNNLTPAQAQETLTNDWFNACENSEVYPIADGQENGYDFALWQLYCPLNPATQLEEYTYMKAIAGNDSFYLAQVAFRYEPTEADVTQWMQYLKQVQVCDSRLAAQACP